jgi:TonB family protein
LLVILQPGPRRLAVEQYCDRSANGQTSQQEQTEGSRRILRRVTPQYPEMARTMNLRGNVKAEAVVEANGVVKSVEVRGGHPVLVRAAQDAIYKWKWAPATRETREPIEVRFDPR